MVVYEQAKKRQDTNVLQGYVDGAALTHQLTCKVA